MSKNRTKMNLFTNPQMEEVKMYTNNATAITSLGQNLNAAYVNKTRNEMLQIHKSEEVEL